MRRLKAARSYVLVALSVLALAACNSTPEGVFEFDSIAAPEKCPSPSTSGSARRGKPGSD